MGKVGDPLPTEPKIYALPVMFPLIFVAKMNIFGSKNFPLPARTPMHSGVAS